jgi:hypothetical protein
MRDELSELREKVERARQEKIDKLFALLRDPDLAAYVTHLRNGHASIAMPAATRPQSPKAQPPRKPGFRGGNGIQSAILALADLPFRFSAKMVLEKLEDNGFQFAGKDHAGSVRDAVFALCRKDKLRLAARGMAFGEPNLYEKV